jgi:hypothetical protein
MPARIHRRNVLGVCFQVVLALPLAWPFPDGHTRPMPLFNRGIQELLSGSTDWDGATDVRVMLVDADYVFDPDDNVVADLVAEELAGASGYARQTLASRTLTEDDTGNRVVLDAADTAFGALGVGGTIGGIVVFRHTGSDATAALIGFLDVSPSIPTNGSTFTAQWSADGLFYADSP